jgi:hypothetical protein
MNINLTIDEIKNLPNDADLGRHIRNKANFELIDTETDWAKIYNNWFRTSSNHSASAFFGYLKQNYNTPTKK